MIKRLIVAVLFISITFAFVVSQANAQMLDNPVIVYAEGTVTVNITGTFEPAEKGKVLDGSSIIKTSADSYCDIAFDSAKKNIISIGPNSEVNAGQFNNKVKLLKGRVFAQLDGLKKGSTFEVETPVAIAGARGTAWETIFEKIARFNVAESTINVSGKGGSKDVGEGSSIDVDELGRLGKMLGLSDEDMERLMQWSQRIRTMHKAGGSEGDLNKLLAKLLQDKIKDGEGFAAGEGGFVGGGAGSGAPGLLGGDIPPGSFKDPVVPVIEEEDECQECDDYPIDDDYPPNGEEIRP